jgi:hypothetical protein
MVAIREPSGSLAATGPVPPTLADPAPTARPIRSSTSLAEGVGTPAGLPTGTEPVQLESAPTSSAAVDRQGLIVLAPVVAKLELEPEVLALEEGDDVLQLVARGSGYPHFVTLDGGLNLLETTILDRLHNSL